MVAPANPSGSQSRGPRRGLPRLPPRSRKALAIVHVAASVGWLGVTLCLLTLGTTGLLTGDPETLRAAYRAMKVLGDTLIIPISLLSLATGLWLSLATPWGLFRYRWVAAKFWLTLAATVASVFALRARLNEAARSAVEHPTGSIAAMHLGFERYNLVIVPSIALCVYLANVAIAVAKPWGRRAPGRG